MVLYILNRDEELMTVLHNDSELDGIQQCELVEDLSEISTLNFEVSGDTEGLEHLQEECHVLTQNLAGKWKLFTVKHITDIHNSATCKRVEAEDVITELGDYVVGTNYQGKTIEPKKVVADLLKGTGFAVGEVSGDFLSTAIDVDTRYMSKLALLQHIASLGNAYLFTDINIEGTEIVSVTVSIKQANKDIGRRFEFDSELVELQRENDSTTIKTAILPLGAVKEQTAEEQEAGVPAEYVKITDVSWTTSAGKPVDKPAGQDYIEDVEATAKYGNTASDGTKKPRVVVMQFSEITDPEVLATRAYMELQALTAPKTNYSFSANDLSGYLATQDIMDEPVEVGDVCYVIDNSVNPPIVEEVIVRRIAGNPDRPEALNIEIGTPQATLVDSDITGSVLNHYGAGGSSSNNGSFVNITATTANIDTLRVRNAQVLNQLDSDRITVETISGDTASFDTLIVDSLNVAEALMDKANIADLHAINATINTLKADVAYVTDLNVVTGKVEALEGKTATFENILAGNITADNMQAGAITAGSGVIADGAIGSAQISDLDASKLTAGTIDTTRVEIAGADGHLQLRGNRLQVFQGTGGKAVERVSIGDVNNDGSVYGLRVRGADGVTVLLDENGVKSEGITDGSITNDKISGDANIDGSKLNINSVITEINEEGTTTIAGNKITVDGTTLNTKLYTITEAQGDMSNTIKQHSTSISANEKAIKAKVDSQTYTADMQGLNSKLNKNTTAISALQGEIALKVEQSDIETAKDDMGQIIDSKIADAKASIKVTTDGISQSVSNLNNVVSNKADGSTVTAIDNKVASLNTTLNGISGKVSKLETTTTTLGNNVNGLQGSVNTLDQSVASLQLTTEGMSSTVNALKTNQQTLTQKVTGVEGAVSTVERNLSTTSNKVSTIENNLDSITQRVASTETTTTTLNSKIDGIQIGGRNYCTTTALANLKSADNENPMTFNTAHEHCPNGFYAVGNKNSLGIIRLPNVINSNGYWTVSFDLRGSQNTSVGMNVDICGLGTTTVKTTDNNSWKRVNVTVNVTNYSKDEYNYVDFSRLAWAYFFVRNIKVEQGNRATDFTPAPEDMQVDINNAINNVQIGGRNLLAGTKTFSKGKGTGSVISEVYEGFTVLYKDNTTSTSYSDVCVWTNSITTKPNAEYTLSFYAKGTGEFVSYFHPDNVINGFSSEGATTTSLDGAIRHQLTADWKKYWITWKVHPNASGKKTVLPFRLFGGSCGYICGIMFEEGNKASAWSPAPEDVQADIDTKANSADVYKKAETYTKTETDSAIKVAKDEINLGVKNTYETKANVETKVNNAVNNIQVGGRNIFRYSGNFGTSVGSYWTNNGGGLTFDSSIKYNGYNTIKTTVGTGIAGIWYKLEPNVEYTYSALVRCNTEFTGNDSVPLCYWAGKDNVHQSKVSVIKYDTLYRTPNEWKLMYVTFKLTGDADSFRPFIYWGTNTSFQFNIAYMKLEKGNKPSDWSPAPEDVNNNISDAIDNIKIGGRNLISPAKVQAHTPYSTVTPNNANGWTITKKETSEVVAIKQSDFSPEVGKTYTFSGYATVNGQPVSDGFFRNNGLNTYLQPADRIVVNNGYFEVVQRWNTSTVWILHCTLAGVTSGAVVDFSNLMLEEGNKASAYTKNPNDVDEVINSKANSADVYKKAEVYTKAQTDSAINVAKNDITLAVSNTYETKTNVETKISTAVNNVQIGGRNLLLNSGFTKGLKYWQTFKTSNAQVVADSSALSGYAVKFTSTGGGIYQRKGEASNNITHYPDGSVMTVSGYVKSSVANKILRPNFEHAGLNTSKDVKCINANTWYYFTHTYTINSHVVDSPGFSTVTFYGDSGADYYLKDVILEYGNKASTWTPAPEDVQGLIDSKANTTDVYNKSETYTKSETDSKIKVAKDEINLGVSNTYETKSNVETKVNNAVSNIKIGGRNLIKDSNFNGLTSNEYGFGARQVIGGLKNNTTYTMTVNGRSNPNGNTDGKSLMCYIFEKSWNYGAWQFGIGETVDTTRSLTFTTGNNIAGKDILVMFYWYPSGGDRTGNATVNWVKVEEGNKATDWTPAPEDIDSAINSKANSTDVYKKTEVYTKAETNSQINVAKDSITSTVSQNYVTKSDATNTYATKSSLTQTTNSIVAKFEASGGYNLIKNSSGVCQSTSMWSNTAGTTLSYGSNPNIGTGVSQYLFLDCGTNTSEKFAFSSRFKLRPNTKYTLTGYFHNYTKCTSFDVHVLMSTNVDETNTSVGFTNSALLISAQNTGGAWKKYKATFTTPASVMSGLLRIDNNGYNANGSGSYNRVHWNALMLVEGELEMPWAPHPDEVYNGSTVIDATGLTVNNGAIKVKNKAGTTVLSGDSAGNLTLTGTIRSEAGNGQYVALNSGGITFRDSQKSEEVLRLNTSSSTSNRDINGVTFAMPQYADYLSFRYIANPSLENGWGSGVAHYTFMDMWSGDFNDANGNKQYKGVNVYAPMYLSQKIRFRNGGDQFLHEITPNITWNNMNKLMGVYGDNGTVIGYKAGDNLQARIVVTEANHPNTGDSIRSWGNWNCTGAVVHNATFNGRHVNSYTNTATRTVSNTAGVMAEGNQVRVNFENVQIKDGKAILSIPKRYRGINDGYIVSSIVKKGRGDVWVAQEHEDRFTIEGEQDIVVNVEVIIKLTEAVVAKTVREDEQLCIEIPNGETSSAI